MTKRTATLRLRDCPENCPSAGKIMPGHHVKVAIRGERFWVLVDSFKAGRVCGWVDNDLVTSSVPAGKRICFPARKVWQTR